MLTPKARLALLGSGISHSRSPEIYQRLLGQEIRYELLDINKASDIPGIDELKLRFDGLNITTPWKTHFSQFAEEAVKDLGAVNCLHLMGDRPVATNTDWRALQELVPAMVQAHRPELWIVLGDGVMARVLKKVLTESGIKFIQYARSLGNDMRDLDLLQDHPGAKTKLVVNACSRGYVFSGKLDGTWVFWDFNYADPTQKMAIQGHAAHYVDGGELLETQAKHAIKFWNSPLTN